MLCVFVLTNLAWIAPLASKRLKGEISIKGYVIWNTLEDVNRKKWSFRQWKTEYLEA